MRRVLIFALAAWTVAGRAGAAVAAPEVGKPAPLFNMEDTHGTRWSLEALRGQYVILEWFNPECPFVRKQYTSGRMQELQAAAAAAGMAWLTVDSSAPGKQGFLTPAQADAVMRERHAASAGMLLDPGGTLGHLYGATATPHMFIINPTGILIYAGAIDNAPSAEPRDVAGALNYVQTALDEARVGRPVSTPFTRPYGCSVKY